MIALERCWPGLQLAKDVAVIVPEVTCVDRRLNMRRDGVWRRGRGACGQAEQVPVELVIV